MLSVMTDCTHAINSVHGAAGDAVLSQLLEDVRRFICRYVVLSPAQSDAIALWVAHTHTLAAAETTPYLEISSAEKESGKTRLLETLQLLVAKPWYTGRTSVSALARKVDAELPTLLLDESDAALASDKTYVQELRGILNSGFRRGGKHTINVPNAQNGWTPTDLSVFCPKAIAGIGSLPDTVVSRSITIRLQRKRSDEPVEKFRIRRASALAEPLRERLELVLPQTVESLIEITEAGPAMPAGLSDRAEDVWEPLLAIADLFDGDWPERARRAAVELAGKRSDDENSHRIQLLRDIRLILNQRGLDQIGSSELVFELNAIETSPWAGWARGRGLSTHSLAKQLTQFGITPRHMRDGSARGYCQDQFDDAFSRYLPALVGRSVKASEVADLSPGYGVSGPPSDATAMSGEAGASVAPSDIDALTLTADGEPERARGWSADSTSGVCADEQAYASAEYERIVEKFPDDFGDA